MVPGQCFGQSNDVFGLAVTNPFIAADFARAIVKGGSIASAGKDCRSASRRAVNKDVGVDAGFRVVLAPINTP